MKINDLLESQRSGGTTLGGFPVKVLHIQDSGNSESEEDVAESHDEVDLEPALKGLESEFDKFLKHGDRMQADPAYAKKWNKRYAKYNQHSDSYGNDPDDDSAGLSESISNVYSSKGVFLGTWDGKQLFKDLGRDSVWRQWEADNGPEWTSDLINSAPEKIQRGLWKLKQDVAEGEEDLNRIRKLSGLEEALKLDAPQKAWSKQDMQDYATRIKTDTKTKQDKFKPIIHGSNIKAITKDDGGTEWDLDDLASQITTPPSSILGTNAKMAKSKKEGAMTYDLTLPALSGIVVDEETGEFVEITTCPGAGECQLFCYARKGGYRMFPDSSMSAARALNFLVNHPTEYMKMFDKEVKVAKAKTDKAGIKLLVRVHDAGDFFSKEYYNLVMDVARGNPDTKFYFYTKMGDIATDSSAPPNVVAQFSSGAKSREVKTVNLVKNAGKHVKDAITLPKDMFRNLFKTDAKGKYVKDEQGRSQVKSPEAWNEFKNTLAAKYKIDPESIITYDQMVKIPEGPKPKWNVVVFPAGHGDLGAPRLDVQNQFLMFH